jgi:uncharacterized protein (TIGR00299 family) protein
MKTLYFECNMGAAGDMLTAALLELFDNKEEIVAKLNQLGLPGVVYELQTTSKCGIQGSHMSVKVNGQEENEFMHDHHHHHDHEHEHHHDHEHEHDHEHHHDHGHHHHTGMKEIEEIVSNLPLNDNVKKSVMDVYGQIGAAESHAHGAPVDQIHFHEVGTMDAIADVVAVCCLMDLIGAQKVICSPIHVGSGSVRCAHGILPVPAPATAFILKEVPTYGGAIKGELCTPTGAALLKHFVDEFGNMPVMRTEKIGYGMGTKDFATANCVRVMLGESADDTDVVCELFCNVDDMNAEAISFAMEALFKDGALEVFTTPIGMKKSRPGTLLSVMCKQADRKKILESIFRHTTTIGVREHISQRYILKRDFETIDTPYGPVRKKTASGYGTSKSKYEYEDLAKIAREQNLSLEEVKGLLEK